MRPLLIVLIFIIILIALIMAYLLIVSNTRSEKGGPSVFDMMIRDGKSPAEGEDTDNAQTAKESDEEPTPTEQRNDPKVEPAEAGSGTKRPEISSENGK